MSILLQIPNADDRVTKFFTPAVVLALIIFTFAMLIALRWVNIDWAVHDGINFIEGKPYNSKALLICTGVVCGMAFFFSRLTYLYCYTDKIWDRYFARSNDKFLFIAFATTQIISIVSFAMFPHYWYVNALVLHLVILVMLSFRYREYVASLRELGFTITKNPLTVKRAGQHQQEDDIILTRFFLLRSAVTHIVYRGFLYEGIFLVMMATCHIVRRFSADPLDLLLIGMYIASALLFTIITVINNTVAGIVRLDILQQRADANDFRYFRVMR